MNQNYIKILLIIIIKIINHLFKLYSMEKKKEFQNVQYVKKKVINLMF